MENLFSFISLITKYKDIELNEEKAQAINDIIYFKKIAKFNGLVPINYKDNLELFINILNYHFYENINNSFKNNKFLILLIMKKLKKN